MNVKDPSPILRPPTPITTFDCFGLVASNPRLSGPLFGTSNGEEIAVLGFVIFLLGFVIFLLGFSFVLLCFFKHNEFLLRFLNLNEFSLRLDITITSFRYVFKTITHSRYVFQIHAKGITCLLFGRVHSKTGKIQYGFFFPVRLSKRGPKGIVAGYKFGLAFCAVGEILHYEASGFVNL